MAIYTPDPEQLGRRRFPDNKGFRRDLLSLSTSLLAQIQNLSASNYPKDPSTNLAILNNTAAREFGRMRYDIDSLGIDKEYSQTRIKFLQQILGERLFLYSRIAPSNYNDEAYRTYLIAIKDAYLKGSQKTTMEVLASEFTGQTIRIKELYLEARDPFSSLGVTDTHKMVVDVLVDNLLAPGYNIGILQNDLDFFINLVKPAHVLYTTRLIWTEQIDVNKIHDLTFGDLGGGCVPTYDYTGFNEPTILAQQVFVLPDSEGATGQIDSIHHDDLVFYLQNSTRVITEPGLEGTRIYNINGRQVSFNALEMGQWVRISYLIIPGEFQFWWYPTDLITTWESQFYKAVFRRPAFQEFVKKVMDPKGGYRFPDQTKATPTTICDRWVQDALQPYYEDFRHPCSKGSTKSEDYSVELRGRMGAPKFSWPYTPDEIKDPVLYGDEYLLTMPNIPLTDGSSNPASVSDVSVSYDGTVLTGAVYSVDASSGQIQLTDSSTYWDTSSPVRFTYPYWQDGTRYDGTSHYPVPGTELFFDYKYLNDASNFDTTTGMVFGIARWQMPQIPMVQNDGSGSLARIADVIVSVDGTAIGSVITDLEPLLGHVTLNQTSAFWTDSSLGRIPEIGDVFDFAYYRGEKYWYSLFFDDAARTTDTFGGLTSFVLDGDFGLDGTSAAQSPDPLMIGYRYRTDLMHHASVLNSPDTLLLNNYQKPALRASIINRQETLNTFNYFFSPEFLYDTNPPTVLNDLYLSNGLDPILKLYPGIPPFQKTFSYNPGLIYERKLQDIRRNHHPLMYADLLLKETAEGDAGTGVSSLCDSERVAFKTRIGEDPLPTVNECPPWIIFDTVTLTSVSVSIPGEFRAVPNLRVPGINLRDNFILREVELTGTAIYNYTAVIPEAATPQTVFNMPSTFQYIYNGETINFPALPIVDENSVLAGVDDVTVTVNGLPWTVTGIDPTTGEITLASFPDRFYVDWEYVITAQDELNKQLTLPGYAIDHMSISLSVVHSSAQFYPDDFWVRGTKLIWRGCGLDGHLSAGDRVRITGWMNPYVNAVVSFTYRIRSTAIIDFVDENLSRITDNGYIFPAACYDREKINITSRFSEYAMSLDDYSTGIKVTYYNTSTYQVEEHVFSGPVFEYYDSSDDEIGAPSNFPNALVRITKVSNPLVPADYGFVDDALVRFRRKNFRELLPDRTYREMQLLEMMPV